MRMELTGGGEVRSWLRNTPPARPRRWRHAVEFIDCVSGMPRSDRPVAEALRPQGRVDVVRELVELGLVA